MAIAARRTYRITVSGAVNEPGTYDIPANACDVLAALTRARGLSEDADTIVEVRHPPTFQTVAQTVGPDGSIMPASAMQPSAQDRMRLDMTRVEALPREQLRLHDGSVVMVSRHPRRMVNVLGLVRNPTAVTIPAGEDLMLLDAIAQAGGTTISFADRVQVVRRVADKPDPVVIEASLRGARSGTADNMKLAPGDVVSVEETPATLVVDTIRTFFRVGFSAAIPGF